MAVDPTITPDMGLVAVLQKIYESLREAIPQQWITLAADISDLMAVRRDFVEDSARLFNRRKDLLDRFISLRAIYVLTILRDLGRLKKVGFDAHVRLLISALDVDMTAVMNKLNAKDSRDSQSGSQPDKVDQPTTTPHPVATLIPGFDVLQSGSALAVRAQGL